jgi:hypothetical protein
MYTYILGPVLVHPQGQAAQKYLCKIFTTGCDNDAAIADYHRRIVFHGCGDSETVPIERIELPDSVCEADVSQVVDTCLRLIGGCAVADPLAHYYAWPATATAQGCIETLVTMLRALDRPMPEQPATATASATVEEDTVSIDSFSPPSQEEAQGAKTDGREEDMADAVKRLSQPKWNTGVADARVAQEMIEQFVTPISYTGSDPLFGQACKGYEGIVYTTLSNNMAFHCERSRLNPSLLVLSPVTPVCSKTVRIDVLIPALSAVPGAFGDAAFHASDCDRALGACTLESLSDDEDGEEEDGPSETAGPIGPKDPMFLLCISKITGTWVPLLAEPKLAELFQVTHSWMNDTDVKLQLAKPPQTDAVHVLEECSRILFADKDTTTSSSEASKPNRSKVLVPTNTDAFIHRHIAPSAAQAEVFPELTLLASDAECTALILQYMRSYVEVRQSQHIRTREMYRHFTEKMVVLGRPTVPLVIDKDRFSRLLRANGLATKRIAQGIVWPNMQFKDGAGLATNAGFTTFPWLA